MNSFIKLKNVTKTYMIGDKKFNALNSVDLEIS